MGKQRLWKVATRFSSGSLRNTQVFLGTQELMTLHLKKIGSKWWILGDHNGPMGPYDTRKDAEADKRGVEDFYDSMQGPEKVQKRFLLGRIQ